jgi:hypothetical protein
MWTFGQASTPIFVERLRCRNACSPSSFGGRSMRSSAVGLFSGRERSESPGLKGLLRTVSWCHHLLQYPAGFTVQVS